jgi:hypothetical protein
MSNPIWTERYNPVPEPADTSDHLERLCAAEDALYQLQDDYDQRNEIAPRWVAKALDAVRALITEQENETGSEE